MTLKPEIGRPGASAAAEPHVECFRRSIGEVGTARGRRTYKTVCPSSNKRDYNDVDTEGESVWPAQGLQSGASPHRIRPILGLSRQDAPSRQPSAQRVQSDTHCLLGTFFAARL